MTDSNNAFDKLTLKCADFIKKKMLDSINKTNSDSAENHDDQKALVVFLMDWCEIYKHYRWAEQVTHLRLWTQIQQSATIWNFVFGDMQTFATAVSAANAFAEDTCALKGRSLASIALSYYSANSTSKYQPMVPNAETNDSNFLMSSQECQLMGKSDEYLARLKENQSWVFVFLFMIECFTLHYNLLDVFSDINQNFVSLEK